jgi:hypothetical protein
MFSLANKIFCNESGSGTIGAAQEGSADHIKETANVSSAADLEKDTTGARSHLQIERRGCTCQW